MAARQTTPGWLLRLIILVYLLLYLLALAYSAGLFYQVTRLSPVPALPFFKYILLIVLFAVLLVIALQAFGLEENRLRRFAGSTANAAWLFVVAALLALAGRAGLFNLRPGQQVQVSLTAIGLLVLLACFCFWSRGKLNLPGAENEDT